MDLDSAVGKHAEWKVKLRGAIQRCETLDAAAVAADNCCDLGRWLHGDARRAVGAAAGPALQDCIAKHAAFHREAGKVAQAINAGKMAEADAMLDAGSPYSAASTGVAGAISRLKRELAAA